jgi:A/G-specific adenine glycosylase
MAKRCQVTKDAAAAFRRSVFSHYRRCGRHDLPWRQTTDPYHILVSEVMLQQTQVPRVIEKYSSFIWRFPDFSTLAKAPLSTVLKEWQGLGYNRRAIVVKKIAEIIRRDYAGKLPQDGELLLKLPGIGPYTAAAILTFAFNLPTVFIETNIRAVFIHTFFGDRKKVSDKEITPLIEQTLDYRNPRTWYWALMDYGVMLKKKFANPARRSSHHKKQSRFEGSNRQLRGRILKLLTASDGLTKSAIAKSLNANAAHVEMNLTALEDEGFIKRVGRRYQIT